MRKKMIIDDIFLKNLPTIDLHGYTGDMARVATSDFINDNLQLKNSKLLIVHGIGEGIVKKNVHEELSRNKHVLNYYIDGFNTGCTIVILDIK
jgi:DNA-nicking Smr family endonuclease